MRGNQFLGEVTVGSKGGGRGGHRWGSGAVLEAGALSTRSMLVV